MIAQLVELRPEAFATSPQRLISLVTNFAEGIAIEVGYFGAESIPDGLQFIWLYAFSVQPASSRNHIRWRAFRRPRPYRLTPCS